MAGAGERVVEELGALVALEVDGRRDRESGHAREGYY